MEHLDYVYLRAWCRMMGSHHWYVVAEVERARKNKAPANTIYFDHHGNAVTFDGITSNSTKLLIERYVKEASQD